MLRNRGIHRKKVVLLYKWIDAIIISLAFTFSNIYRYFIHSVCFRKIKEILVSHTHASALHSELSYSERSTDPLMYVTWTTPRANSYKWKSHLSLEALMYTAECTLLRKHKSLIHVIINTNVNIDIAISWLQFFATSWYPSYYNNSGTASVRQI
jgi:hypothetical protein